MPTFECEECKNSYPIEDKITVTSFAWYDDEIVELCPKCAKDFDNSLCVLLGIILILTVLACIL